MHNSSAFACVFVPCCVYCSKGAALKVVSVWIFGHVGHFAVRHSFVHLGSDVGLLSCFCITCMCLVLASLCLSDGFLW